MNPFSFSGMGAASFGIDRIKQLAKDILTLNGSRVPVVLISDAGVAGAGILAPVKAIARMKMQMSQDDRYVDQKDELLNESLLLLDQVLAAFAAGNSDDGAQPDQAESRCSIHSNRSALILMSKSRSSSRIQVGLVTLISVI